jgi:hypothetical protein
MRFEMVTHAIADPRSAADEVGSVRALTQWYTRQLEEAIRRTPGQYWWLHRRWKDPRKKKGDGQKKAALEYVKSGMFSDSNIQGLIDSGAVPVVNGIEGKLEASPARFSPACTAWRRTRRASALLRRPQPGAG